MALIKCQNCESMISDKSDFCVQCGQKNNNKIMLCFECNSIINSNLHTCPECGAEQKNKTVNYFKSIIYFFSVIGLLGLSILLFDYYNYKKNKNFEKINEQFNLPSPPEIRFSITRKPQNIKNILNYCNLNGEKKQLINSCDYKNPLVRNYALKIIGRNPGIFDLGQICDIFDEINTQWKYINDPLTKNFEKQYVAKASETISNGLNGDCDDYAVTIASLILSIGGEIRISYAYGPDDGHAFTEVNIGNTDIYHVTEYISKRYTLRYEGNINYRTDILGNKWLNLDWFSKYPGGKYFNYTSGTCFYILQNYCENF